MKSWNYPLEIIFQLHGGHQTGMHDLTVFEVHTHDQNWFLSSNNKNQSSMLEEILIQNIQYILLVYYTALMGFHVTTVLHFTREVLNRCLHKIQFLKDVISLSSLGWDWLSVQSTETSIEKGTLLCHAQHGESDLI